jgi:hypothetical protein
MRLTEYVECMKEVREEYVYTRLPDIGLIPKRVMKDRIPGSAGNRTPVVPRFVIRNNFI